MKVVTSLMLAALLLMPAWNALAANDAADPTKGLPAVPESGFCKPGNGCFPVYVDEEGDTMSGNLVMKADVEIMDPNFLRWFDQSIGPSDALASFMTRNESLLQMPTVFTSTVTIGNVTLPAAMVTTQATPTGPALIIQPGADLFMQSGSNLTFPGGSYFDDDGLVLASDATLSGTGNSLRIVNGATLFLEDGGEVQFNEANLVAVDGPSTLGTESTDVVNILVNNQPAFRLEPTATTANLVGGHENNAVSSGAAGGAVGGGGSATGPNSVTDSMGTVAGGEGNQAGDGAGAADDAGWATVGGGSSNQAVAAYSTIPGGYEAETRLHGQMAYAAGGFSGETGTAQRSTYVLRAATSDDTQTELFLDGASKRLTIPTDGLLTFDGTISAMSASGDVKGWRLEGLIKNVGGTTSLVDRTFIVLGQDFGAVPWGLSVTGDNANDSLKIAVTGEVGESIRWVASLDVTETKF